MTQLHLAKSQVDNLPKLSRIIRGLVGAGLIAFVMTTPSAPLGWYALLPLLAIFPIFTAITGWDPVKAFFQHPWVTHRALSFSPPARYLLAAMGVALIASVYVAAYLGGSLGWLAILPIIGIYPLTAAITGMDLITALYNMDHTVVEPEVSGGETVTLPRHTSTLGVLSGHKGLVAHHEQRNRNKAA